MANQVKGTKKILDEGENYSIEVQSAVVEGWWRHLASIYNPKINHAFIRDIPTDIVSKFLIEKAICQDDFNA